MFYAAWETNLISDLRRGNCFRVFARGMCQDPIPVNMTKYQCCCTMGEAWSPGRSEYCEVCPIKGEGMEFYSTLKHNLTYFKINN